MAVETTAQERLRAAHGHLRAAAKNFSALVNDQVAGSDALGKNTLARVRKALYTLSDVADALEMDLA